MQKTPPPSTLLFAFLVVFTFFVFGSVLAQNKPADAPKSAVDAGFLTRSARAAEAFSGGTAVSDVRLSGAVVQTIGDRRTGTVVLAANSSGQSKVELNLTGSSRTEYHSGANEEPACSWTSGDGSRHDTAIHNCWGLGAWFLPAISFAAAQSGIGITGADRGVESIAGSAQQHWTIKRAAAIRPASQATLAQQLGTSEIYVDPGTMLVSSVKFNTHPEDDLRTDIPVEVRFTDYRIVNGITVPFHIQKFLNGVKALDIIINSVAVNTGSPIQP